MILITGSKGFIGSQLIDHFYDIDIDIYEIEQEQCFLYLDATPWERVTKIYHLGAISSTTETNIDLIYRHNIDFSIKLFEKAIEYKIPVVYASSASVYGNSTEASIQPLNYYSMSKAMVDMFVSDNMHRFANIVGCRFFNVYGKGEDHKGSQASPIHQFTKQAKETGVIKIFTGSENYYRDFVWVEDCIDFMLKERTSGIYDVGTGLPVSFREVAECVAKKYNASIEEIPFPKHLMEKYQYYTCADSLREDFISARDYLESSV